MLPKVKAILLLLFNPIALREAKIAYNLGLSECNRVNDDGILFPVNIIKHLH